MDVARNRRAKITALFVASALIALGILSLSSIHGSATRASQLPATTGSSHLVVLGLCTPSDSQMDKAGMAATGDSHSEWEATSTDLQQDTNPVCHGK